MKKQKSREGRCLGSEHTAIWITQRETPDTWMSSVLTAVSLLHTLLRDKKKSLTCMYAQLLSRVQLSATTWIVAQQSPLSMGFSRQEYWNALPFPSPGYLPNPGTEATSPVSPVLAGRFFTTEPPRKPITTVPMANRAAHCILNYTWN